MSIDDVKTLLVDLAGGGAISLITWLFSSRHRLAQVKKLELENEQTASKIYRDLCDDLRKQVADLIDRQRTTDERVQVLENENQQLRAQLREIQLNSWRTTQ